MTAFQLRRVVTTAPIAPPITSATLPTYLPNLFLCNLVSKHPVKCPGDTHNLKAERSRVSTAALKGSSSSCFCMQLDLCVFPRLPTKRIVVSLLIMTIGFDSSGVLNCSVPSHVRHRTFQMICFSPATPYPLFHLQTGVSSGRLELRQTKHLDLLLKTLEDRSELERSRLVFFREIFQAHSDHYC